MILSQFHNKLNKINKDQFEHTSQTNEDYRHADMQLNENMIIIPNQ